MKNRNKIAAGAIVIAAALAMAVAMLASAAPAQGTFSNFGNARVVIGGLYPGLAATELTSIICAQAAFAPNCDGLWSSQGGTSDSGIAWVPTTQPLLSTITLLYTFYNMGATDCFGGSPRFVIRLNDGMNSTLSGYLGLPPGAGSFNSCPVGWQNTGNFVKTSDPTTRWAIATGNGSTISVGLTYADASAAFQSAPVSEIDLVVDGGTDFVRGQDMLVDHFQVNNDILHISQ